MRRAEGDLKIVGVFRVKNHDFSPKNHIFSNFRWGGEGATWIRPWYKHIKMYTNIVLTNISDQPPSTIKNIIVSVKTDENGQ
jgi:hypothetical protein